ncbi:hypothetical protein BGZ76_001143 [Entomortierella beljakovae]|nr:hypothetical protein BGZ76_001143 [Entomortierella beljakovae]
MSKRFGFGSFLHGPTAAVIAELHFLEEYALKPESRQELVNSLVPGEKVHLLSQLQQISHELQEASIDPSNDAASSDTAEKIEKGLRLLRSTQPFSYTKDVEKWTQFQSQFAILGYFVKPELLRTELGFSSDTINQIIAASASTQPDEGLDKIGICDSLPVSLDESLLNMDTLLSQLMDKISKNSNSTTSIPDLAWPHLLAQPRMRKILLFELTDSELLNFFNRMNHPLSSKGFGLIENSLTSQLVSGNSRGVIESLTVEIMVRLLTCQKLDFSRDFIRFRNLTCDQLEWIKVAIPSAINHEGFVGLLENHILPRNFEVDPRSTVDGEWLSLMITFVDSLSQKFNRHKVAVYLMSLEYDLAQGKMDRFKFMKFITIPKSYSTYNIGMRKTFDPNGVVDLISTQAFPFWSQRVKPATKERDAHVVKEILSHFLLLDKSSSAFVPYFDGIYLNPLLAKVMLFSGDQDFPLWSRLLGFHDGGFGKFTDQTIIKFDHENPGTFLPSELVVFKLKVKNAKRILIRVFEIKTLEYLQQYGGESALGQDLNLDGLTPYSEKVINLNHPPLELHDLTIDLPELVDRRGAFVMDVISNGENSTAYFTKGSLDFVERQSVAGHVLTVIDENKQKISDDVSILFNGFYYKTNTDGDIIIPYRAPASSTSGTIYITHKDFTSKQSFTQLVESYDMNLLCFVDHESLIAGSTAKVLIKAAVNVSEACVTCPVELLEQVVLEVTTIGANDIVDTTTIPGFKLHDADWAVYELQVPENLTKLSVTLSAKIKVLSTVKFDELSVNETIQILSPTCDINTVIRTQNGKYDVRVHGEILTVLRASKTDGAETVYSIHVLGKNGERRSSIPLEICLEHSIWPTTLDVFLRSDSNGIIHLGKLKDIKKITFNNTTWNILSHGKQLYHDRIYEVSGNPIVIPFARKDPLFVPSISLFQCSPDTGNSWCLLKDFTSNIKIEDNLLVIKGILAGYYKLTLGNEAIVWIIVSSPKTAIRPTNDSLEEFNLESNPMLQVMDIIKYPLYISKVTNQPSKENVCIQVHNWSPATRISVIASKFSPHKPIFKTLCEQEFSRPWLKHQAKQTRTAFRVGRVLGEEYQYILNRRTQSTHWAGNLLSKPGFVISPWSLDDTYMSKEHMAGQNLNNVTTHTNAANNLAGGGGTDLRKGGATRHRKILPPWSPPLLNFLSNPSVVIVNLTPNQETGILEIPYSMLEEGNFLQILAIDGTQTIQQSIVMSDMSETEPQIRDLRFKSVLDFSRHYIAERLGLQLNPWLNKAGTQGIFRSVTLPSDGNHSSAVRIINSVKQNKMIKSFMDDFFIGASLEKYTSLREFSILTCLEKCLLAQRIPRLRPSVAQWIRSRVVTTNVTNDFKLFETIMRSKSTAELPGVIKSSENTDSDTDVTLKFGDNRRRVESDGDDDEDYEIVAPSALIPSQSTTTGFSFQVPGTSAPIVQTTTSFIGSNPTISAGDTSTGSTASSGSLLVGSFGTPAGGGQSTITPSAFASLEPAPTPPTGSSAFGSASGSSAGGSLFGTAPTAPTGSSLFGAAPPAQVGGGLFGAPAAPSSSVGSSLFGAPAASGSSVGSSLFGAAPAAPSSSVGSSLFGAPAASSSSVGGSLFGTASAAPTGSSLFGSAPAASYPSAGGSLSGGAPTPAGSGLFGATTTAPTGSSLFGTQGSSTGVNPFGNTASAPFGSFTSASNFGASTSTSTFNFGARPAVQSQNYQQARAQAQVIIQQHFKPGDLTKETAETYYWRQQDFAYEKGSSDVNAFWLDYVEWDESKEEPFLSENFVANTKTFTDVMATLALLDVEFRPKATSIKRSSDLNVVVSSASPAIVYYSSTKEVKEVSVNESIHVTQQYFEKLEKTEYDPKLRNSIRRFLKPDAEFTPLESYGAVVVLMNATPNPMKLHIEVQLPRGAISICNPLQAGLHVQLTGYGTYEYEYHFYFPEEGDFQHYPAHVSDYEDIIAFASPSVLKVRKFVPGHIKNTVNTKSWGHVLSRGTQDEVLEKLRTDPLEGLKPELLISRLYTDKGFLKSITDVLRERNEYNDRIWSVSLMFNDANDKETLSILREYIANKAITQKLGYWFKSNLVTRKPRHRQEFVQESFEYFEYFPLINARAHKANKSTTILNDRFKGQYYRFMTLLCQKPKHDTEDLLVLVVYLLAQDRVLEAKQFFAKLDVMVKEGHLDQLNDSQEERPEGENSTFQQIQYDYLRAYLSLCVEVQVDASATDIVIDLDDIMKITKKYHNYPVRRWDILFKDMKNYVDEISKTVVKRRRLASTQDMEQDDIVLVAPAEDPMGAGLPTKGIIPSRKDSVNATVDFKIGSDGQISIFHRGADQVIIEYYSIDAETMFSESPLTFCDQGEAEINIASSGATTAGAVTDQPSKYRDNGRTRYAQTAVANSSDKASYRLVKPNGIDKHNVEFSVSAGGVLKVPVLEKYLNTNVMISVSTVPVAATKTWKACYSQTITVQCQEAEGIIRVITKPCANNDHESQPIPGGYVKVYAELKSDSKYARFWKDGYTDLVGRFNYAHVSSAIDPSSAFNFAQSNTLTGLANVRRFVVFIDGGKEGCMVKTVPVPSA